MEKPKITEELANEGSCVVYTNDDRVTDTMVSDMIDALIDVHGTLESLTYSGADKFVVEEELKKIKQALTKAGCHE